MRSAEWSNHIPHDYYMWDILAQLNGIPQDTFLWDMGKNQPYDTTALVSWPEILFGAALSGYLVFGTTAALTVLA